MTYLQRAINCATGNCDNCNECLKALGIDPAEFEKEDDSLTERLTSPYPIMTVGEVLC